MSGIAGITDSGALPTLALSMRFAGQRQRLLAHNVANLTTPGFQTTDVEPRAFQRSLAEAIERRRDATGGQTGALPWRGTRSVGFDDRGAMELRPKPIQANILAHDRNNRDLERSMQALAENAAFFRMTVDLMRFEGDRLTRAMRETV